VNAGVIPRVNGLKSPPTKDASPPSRNSLERDLGIGTSGEDESSESSLSKKKKAGKGLNYPMKEFYNNEGYWSDDEEGANHAAGPNRDPSGPRAHASSSNHQRNHSSSNPRSSNSLSHNPSNHRGRSGSLPHEPPMEAALGPNGTLPPSSSAKRKSSRGSYINESKFP